MDHSGSGLIDASSVLDADERLGQALRLAYRHLNRRERTVGELRLHLERHRIEEATIAATLAELGERGYLDDAAYAARFAEEKRALGDWGRDRIQRVLRQRGLDDGVIFAALEGRDRDEELRAAAALLRRRYPGGVGGERDRARAHALLLRKGYDPELVHDALAEQIGA